MPDPVTISVGVGWGISILGWLISPNMTKLFNKGWSYLGDVAGSSADKLQDLESKVQRLKLMLEAVRVSPDDEKKLERWVKKLKSAFYDAEDILDAIDYHRLYGQALLHRQSVNTTKEKATAKEDFKFPRGSEDSLRKTLKEIERLINEGETLLPLLRLTTSCGNNKSSQEQTTGSGSHSKTTSKPPNKVFGRNEDAKSIIRMLHDTAADHFAIVIHGFAGSGKSTLAQYVCESEKKKFDLFMWIQVTENFSVDAIYKEMLEMVPGKKMDRVSNLDQLETELLERLEGKRLLLVLDDVWYSSESVTKQDNVKKLLSPFMEADKGSRVLLTSRNADAAKLLDVAHHLEPISDMNKDEFLKMFMHYALDNSMVTDQAPRSKFETVGKDIAALLQRSPLAARTVAGQLRRKPLRFWIDTSMQKENLLKDTTEALWWSYHQLEEHVRQCFAYCSMFPRRYELKREELVKMWMAQGFGDTSKTSNIESAADECFEVLLSTSFIQLKPNTDYDQEYYVYTVHDLLHDLAGTVAGSDCFTIEKDMVVHQIPQDVRHLFINSNNVGEFMEQIVKLDTLRTLVISSSATTITAEEFKRMLKDLKKLRFVSVWLEEFGGNVIPECIGELKHLRYLGLYGPLDTGIIYLPGAFTQLYHLQEISVPGAFKLLCPDSNFIADLVNRRHFPGLEVSIPYIGRMPWLQTQTLNAFTVKKEKGYEITQLENLNNIHGLLGISGLGNIQSKEDACQANLSHKQHVTRLVFDWETYDDEGRPESSRRKKRKTTKVTPEPEEILEALHPPALLVQLNIVNYYGSIFPSWLSGEDGKLQHLESLSFSYCDGSGSQFKFSKPLPKLHTLDIDTCSWNALPDNIKQLASLEKLIISRCKNIQSLPGLPSSHKKLVIIDCPHISTLPELPPSLEELQIKDCPNISLPGLPSSLKYLAIWQGCANISTLPELPPSLEELHIQDFPNIKSLPGLPSSLKKLAIWWGCPNISTLPKLPPSLKELLIEDCPNIKSLPGLPSSLKNLQIKFCGNIKTLPELPPSLEELECEQYLVDSYHDREAIARIKEIFIV